MVEIPPSIAQAFMKDLKRFHATKEKDKRTEIAVRQREALSKATGKRVTMEEVYELLRRMRG